MAMALPFESQRICSVLVIGGSGFIGSHIVEHLVKEAGPGSITGCQSQYAPEPPRWCLVHAGRYLRSGSYLRDPRTNET